MSSVSCCFGYGELVWVDDMDVIVPGVGWDGETGVLASGVMWEELDGVDWPCAR